MAAWENIDAYLISLGVRIGAPTPAQTSGGTHAPGSYHHPKMGATARDYGDGWPQSDCKAVVRALEPFATGPNYKLAELFYTPLDVFYKNGKRASWWTRRAVAASHRDHVHAALRPGYQLPVVPAKPPTKEEASKMIKKPAVKVLSSLTGNGYMIVASDGGCYCFGDFEFFGSMGGKVLAAPIVDAELHPSGKGYWLLGADGGIFAFGAAKYMTTPEGKGADAFIS